MDITNKTHSIHFAAVQGIMY